jgi:two-component system, response regulator PdtaR
MLGGRTVLIVEEEFLIALDIQGMLEDLGVGETLLARNADEADLMIGRADQVHLAIVEVRPDAPEGQRLLSRCRQHGIPVIVCTGDFELKSGAPALAGAPLVFKPVHQVELSDAINKVLGATP